MSNNEIMQALEQGQKVYCINEYNSYMTALAEAEYNDCFIKGV